MQEDRINSSEFFLDEKHLAKTLFEHATIGIVIADENGTIQLANGFCHHIFGYKNKELEGSSIEKLIPGRFRQRHQEYRRLFADNPIARPMGRGMDLFGLKKDGTEIPVEVSLGHYTHESQTLLFAFINDISQRKAVEHKIVSLNNHLEETVNNRTEMLRDALKQLEYSRDELDQSLTREKELNLLKSKFVSVASHEFRTPLTSILSSTILLQKYTLTEQQPQRSKHITRIFSSINTLNCILNDFLSLGRIEEGRVDVKTENVDIDELVSDILLDLRSILKTGQEFQFTQNGPKDVLTDPSMLKHILVNLASNAIKFSPENSQIELTSVHKGSQLVITIRDHGIGIPEEDKLHLFEPFYRAQNASAVQGTGLGLNIVANYVKMLNGTIECKSVVGEGTEMKLTINSPTRSDRV